MEDDDDVLLDTDADDVTEDGLLVEETKLELEPVLDPDDDVDIALATGIPASATVAGAPSAHRPSSQ